MNDKDKIIKLLEEKVAKLEAELSAERFNRRSAISPYVLPPYQVTPSWEYPTLTCKNGATTSGAVPTNKFTNS